MLDKVKLLKNLKTIVPNIIESEKEIEIAFAYFKWLQQNQTIAKALSKMDSKYLMPFWYNNIDQSYIVEPYKLPYKVLAVDGSQIYPDRHQGISCFLLNIGFAYFEYGINNSKVNFNSLPMVFNENNFQDLSVDLINYQRTELELSLGYQQSLDYKKILPDLPYLFMFDGSLIFWHLDNKDQQIKEKFLKSYIKSLDDLYQQSIFNVSYISLPNSKELVNVIKTGIYHKIIDIGQNSNELNSIVDIDLCNFFLKPFTRSTIFFNKSSIVDLYPDHLKPCFVYLNVGSEIARIEFPRWMLDNILQLNVIFEIIFDQCVKGNGYPIALAEAHEAAVIKAPDRELFYDLLFNLLSNQSLRYKASVKSLRKRIIGI